MLPLKAFSLSKPKTMAELKNLLKGADPSIKIIAGGTDVLPNLKHGLYRSTHLISLALLEDLKSIEHQENRVSIKAMVSLKTLSKDASIQARMPALSHAAMHIASPQIRAMGTVGGNVCLDTRCSYFNQTEFWRRSLGYCLKKDGTVCHVVKTGKRCVAASSNDLATMLLAYGAKLELSAPQGERCLKLGDFYTANGEKNNVLAPNEIVSSVTIDIEPECFGGFAKLRHRQSFDFPLLSIGVCFRLKEERLVSGLLVINALVAKPKVLDLAFFAGEHYKSSLVTKIASFAKEKCHPQSNMIDCQDWRRDMVKPFTERAFFNARPFRE